MTLKSDNGKSRIHIKKHLPEYGAEVNCFGDTAHEVVALVLGTLEMLENPPEPLPPVQPSPNQAQREMANAVALDKARQSQAAAQPKPEKPQAPKGNGGGQQNAPICQGCGSTDAMELIRWSDKNTGEAKRGWKCQACQTWARS